MKGYLSIKEAARKWGFQSVGSINTAQTGVFPVRSVLGGHGQFQTPPRSPLTRDLRNIAGIAERQTAEKCLCKEDTARK